MTANEFQQILIEGLIHTDDSRTEFYLIKAKEHGYIPLTFFNGLHAAYQELRKYVNSYHYDSWTINEVTGEKIYPKKTINLNHLPNAKFNGILDHENTLVLAQSLYELGNIVVSHNTKIPDKWKPLQDGLIDLGYIEASKNFSKAMKEHHLPENDKIHWMGARNAAVYFSQQYKFKLSDFNRCFKHHEGKPFELHDLQKGYRKPKLRDLIKQNIP